jgi:choline dehydrogenase
MPGCSSVPPQASAHSHRFRLNHSIESQRTMSFDYVIVGGGSAGCVLAARLSENPQITVLLLEAGPEDRNPWIHIPIGVGKTIRNKAVNWLYATEPDPVTSNRPIPLPRGKVLGGSSSINGHMVTRCQPEDYDDWAKAGNPGWDYASLLPYFKKIENTVDYVGPTRGTSGPITVERSPGLPELSKLLVAAAKECGIPFNQDPNSGNVNGIGYTQRAIRNGMRMSAAKAYVKPARKRSNLTVQCNALTTKIRFEGLRAVGVDYVVNGEKFSANARQEVVLSAGAIGSPQLLELSGVGQAERLKALGIDVVLDLPGVGENLQDHFLARGAWQLTKPITYNERSSGWPLVTEAFKYVLFRKGFLNTAVSHMVVFTRSEPDVDRPDLELTITPFTSTKSADYKNLDTTPGVFFACVPIRPRSRGHVHIKSADPTQSPAITPNYLHDEQDQKITIAGLKLIRQIMKSKAFDDSRGDELWPATAKQTDAELLQHARDGGLTIHHVVGSCRMGPKDEAGMNVVDAELRVHGLQGLRVVDASIMPTLPSGHTNFPTLAVAERAADLIRFGRTQH